MRYIDAYNHFIPKRYFDKIMEVGGSYKDIGKRVRGVPALYDLDLRLKIVEEFKASDYSQVLSLTSPVVEAIASPQDSPDIAKLGNDGLRELCDKYPDHFVGFVTSLPMNNPEAAARETERSFTELNANGIQLHTNVNGRALDHKEFWPIFEICEKYNKPILLHPLRGADMPDYEDEDKSKYEIWWTFGWPYETSTAMARLVFSGIMDAYPKLKVVAHHLGAMVPYFEGRVGPGWDQLGSRTSDEDYGPLLKGLKKRPLDYFKDFYADSAVFGSRAATQCGLEFYGADRVVFATDCPYDPEKGPGYIRETIKVIESLGLGADAHAKIAHKNAEDMFGIAGR